MPKQDSFVGAMQNIFFGIVGATGPLQPIRDIRTEGLSLSENFPRQFIPFLNQYVQAGLDEIKVNLAFYGTSDDVWRISRGMALTAAASGPPGNAQYSVLCVFPSTTISRCFYFPIVTTTSPASTGTYKDKPTAMRVELSGSTDNPTTNPLVYKGTIAEMASIIGSRFPGLMY